MILTDKNITEILEETKSFGISIQILLSTDGELKHKLFAEIQVMWMNVLMVVTFAQSGFQIDALGSIFNWVDLLIDLVENLSLRVHSRVPYE